MITFILSGLGLISLAIIVYNRNKKVPVPVKADRLKVVHDSRDHGRTRDHFEEE